MTILSNLNSREGGAGGDWGWGGGWGEGVFWKDRFVGGKKDMSNVLPGASSMYKFSHKLCEIFFPVFSPHLALPDFRLACFSILRPLRLLLGLHPLAKRRIYWLSWTSGKSKPNRPWISTAALDASKIEHIQDRGCHFCHGAWKRLQNVCKHYWFQQSTVGGWTAGQRGTPYIKRQIQELLISFVPLWDSVHISVHLSLERNSDRSWRWYQWRLAWFIFS